jgi:hypothetical protein
MFVPGTFFSFGCPTIRRRLLLLAGTGNDASRTSSSATAPAFQLATTIRSAAGLQKSPKARLGDGSGEEVRQTLSFRFDGRVGLAQKVEVERFRIEQRFYIEKAVRQSVTRQKSPACFKSLATSVIQFSRKQPVFLGQASQDRPVAGLRDFVSRLASRKIHILNWSNDGPNFDTSGGAKHDFTSTIK